MKANLKKKIELLEGLSCGEKPADELVVKTMAKLYMEFSDRPGEYLNECGEPRTQKQIDEECRYYYPFIVKVVLPEGRRYEIAEAEDEIEME